MDISPRMASSSSFAVPYSEHTSSFISQTEHEMESSKIRHWSQLDYSSSDSECSAETNRICFELLKEDPQYGRFFTEFDTLMVGEKISEGAQADIYEARMKSDGPFNLVVKVMKGDAPLQSVQSLWPSGMLSARSKFKYLYDLPLITILGGTVLKDKRLKGRFAFVMYRRWGDLRLLIDRRMTQSHTSQGPFPINQAIQLMLAIAQDMDILHNKHGILHRDLKASNVLVWGEFAEDARLVTTTKPREKLETVVADFECSVGVLGTGFWRAPEILQQLKDRVPRSQVKFTREADVYSYGMVCYEIVTGYVPFVGLYDQDLTSDVLRGRRPELALDLPLVVRNVILGCWHSDPLERPNFSDICMMLKYNKTSPVVVDNSRKRDATFVTVEQWSNRQLLTLLEAVQQLMDIDLQVLKASDSSSTDMVTQYFEVTDLRGRKIFDEKFIGNMTKALNLPVTMKPITDSVGRSIEANRIAQRSGNGKRGLGRLGVLGYVTAGLVSRNI